MTIKKSGNNEALRSYINEWYDEIILWDGLDDAIIGIDDDQERVIYSRRKMVDIFMSNGMTK